MRKEMTQEGRTGNGHAASPRHLHPRCGPVYGLARSWRAAFPCATRAQWPEASRVEAPRRAHARLPLRGQHRLSTCFPF